MDTYFFRMADMVFHNDGSDGTVQASVKEYLDTREQIIYDLSVDIICDDSIMRGGRTPFIAMQKVFNNRDMLSVILSYLNGSKVMSIADMAVEYVFPTTMIPESLGVMFTHDNSVVGIGSLTKRTTSTLRYKKIFNCSIPRRDDYCMLNAFVLLEQVLWKMWTHPDKERFDVFLFMADCTVSKVCFVLNKERRIQSIETSGSVRLCDLNDFEHVEYNAQMDD